LVGFPYIPTDIDLDIDIMLTIRKHHLVSLFECTISREYLLDCAIYRAIIYEVEVEIRGESIEIIEKVAGSSSLECEVFSDVTLKYLFEDLEHDESVFFSIEHN
jgi:phosphorylcholine metabolism protein LicD